MDLSVWSQQLVDYLTAHLDSEREVLRSYAQLVEDAEPGHVRYLVELILADEVRHHQLFGEMINALRAEMDQRDISPRPARAAPATCGPSRPAAPRLSCWPRRAASSSSNGVTRGTSHGSGASSARSTTPAGGRCWST